MTTLLPLATDPETACCTPGSTGLAAEAASDVARTLKALSDPARVRLLSIVAASPEGTACICDLTGPVALSQPTVSHHMKLLVEAGLVTREQRGRWAHYAVAPHAREVLHAAIDSTLPAA